jgi:hypothetical protein
LANTLAFHSGRSSSTNAIIRVARTSTEWNTTNASIQELLQSMPSYAVGLEPALSNLKFKEIPHLSEDLKYIKNWAPQSTGNNTSCGLATYLLDREQDEILADQCSLLGHAMRDSRLLFERNFYDQLYTKITTLWNNSTRIILTGNSGTGKSLFQIYLLRRLLNEEKPYKYQFVVHQFEKTFLLYHFETCRAWSIGGDEFYVKKLLNSIKGSLYFFEPGSGDINSPPLGTTSRAISFLSPRPRRIKAYKKQNKALSLYMPVWTYDELHYIVLEENIEAKFFAHAYNKFGGIIRHTLETNPYLIDEYDADLLDRCKNAPLDVLRSVNTGIDDEESITGDKRDLSGFLLSFTDIPETGPSAFKKYSLTWTSEYASRMVAIELGVASVQDAVRALIKTLYEDCRGGLGDYLGKDLEISAVHFLALGYRKLPWQYIPVGGDPSKGKFKRNARPLKLDKRKVMSKYTEPNITHLCYPTSPTFGLVDCFTMENGTYHAFQITWQASHPFKLSSLWRFRKLLQLGTNDTLNLYFVTPERDTTRTYINRFKEDYLEKGQDLDADILDVKGNLVLAKAGVKEMWQNTHIYSAFPADWPKSFLTWCQYSGIPTPLSVLKKLKKTKKEESKL